MSRTTGLGQYARTVSIGEKSDINISNNKQFRDTYWYIGEEHRICKRDHTTGENRDGGREGGVWVDELNRREAKGRVRGREEGKVIRG